MTSIPEDWISKSRRIVKEAQSFVADNPEYVDCQENSLTILGSLMNKDLFPNKTNIQETHDSLKKAGKLVENTGVTPLTPEQLTKYEQKELHQSYFHKLLVAFDMFVNVLFGGHPDETISSRSGRAAREGKTWGIVLAKFLDLFQKDHCAKAAAADLERGKQVDYIEEKSGNL